jgi:hypothetical protein
MLELLFQSLEQSFGPSLSRLSFVVYLAGLLVLVLSCSIPLYRLWRDFYAERVGLVRRWVITCEHCRKPTYVTGTHCAYCEADLRIPWTLRGIIPMWSERHGKLARHLKRASRLAGIVAFLVATALVVMALGVTEVQGSLPKLFVGFSLLAWTAFGRLAARAVSLEGGGCSGRFTEAIMAGVALVIFAGTALLADAARTQSEAHLVRLTTSDHTLRIGDHVAVAIPSGEVRFEYLQLDHKVLGYQRIIPLVFRVGGNVTHSDNDIEQWFAKQLLPYADGRSRRGLLIRLRTEHLRLAPGETYDLIHRGGQILLQPVGTA